MKQGRQGLANWHVHNCGKACVRAPGCREAETWQGMSMASASLQRCVAGSFEGLPNMLISSGLQPSFPALLAPAACHWHIITISCMPAGLAILHLQVLSLVSPTDNITVLEIHVSGLYMLAVLPAHTRVTACTTR